MKYKLKKYKFIVRKYKNRHQAIYREKLRTLNKNEPKKYWKIINGILNKESSIDVSVDDFFEFFKNQNNINVDENSFNINFDEDSEPNDILNGRITEEEIKVCIKRLKNGKARGVDEIINEYIKNTQEIMIPIYVLLFNYILDSGVMPESWTIGIIKPIYKNKGDKTQPSNYRPITILSCMGKLFTAVLNRRLSQYLENNNLLNENQAGFRKGYSTSDNIFVLYGLIELLKARKRKLYCVFIDFQKAFDMVWRVGLWRKLLNTNIKGEFFRIIHNMYQNIKSCVKVENVTSDFFTCNTGVRQGENLSPLLFSVFLNDLENFMYDKFCTGVEILDYELMLFLKIIVVLYADDTIIVADSAECLQQNINVFNEYCNLWKLTVNCAKTKVVIF